MAEFDESELIYTAELVGKADSWFHFKVVLLHVAILGLLITPFISWTVFLWWGLGCLTYAWLWLITGYGIEAELFDWLR